MNITPQVVQIDLESLDRAFDLLRRFFQEEGFTIPLDMRTSLEAMIHGPGSAVFLAESRSQILGVATVTTSIGLEYSRSAEIDDLYVLPEARGQGIAGALIEAVCDWCADQGCSVVLVTVTPDGQDRHDLMGFYQKHRFYNTGRIILERRL
jgi:aminoglycoside 6'-N-acetyltransferase I